jgi:hypothetical protein
MPASYGLSTIADLGHNLRERLIKIPHPLEKTGC